MLGWQKQIIRGSRKALQTNCSQVLIINNDIEFEDKLLEKMLSIQKQKKCPWCFQRLCTLINQIIYGMQEVSLLRKKDTCQFILVFNKKDKGQYNGVYPVEYTNLLSFG